MAVKSKGIRKIIIFRLLLFLMMSSGISMAAASSTKAESGIQRYSETIKVKGLRHQYRILVVSDMHIIDLGDSSIVRNKRAGFNKSKKRVTYRGEGSASRWKKIAAAADRYGADHLILLGDIVDYGSKDNYKILTDGLKKIKTPCTFVLGNHDVKVSRSSDFRTFGQVLNQYPFITKDPVVVDDLGEIQLISINDISDSLNKATWSTLQKTLKASKKPALIFIHKPLITRLGKRYIKKLLTFINTGKSNIFGVFSGHLHMYQRRIIGRGVEQVIVPAAFQGCVMLITVK